MNGPVWNFENCPLHSNILCEGSGLILGLLAPQSGAHTIAPHRDPSNPIQPNPIPLIAPEKQDPEKTHDVIYF